MKERDQTLACSDFEGLVAILGGWYGAVRLSTTREWGGRRARVGTHDGKQIKALKLIISLHCDLQSVASFTKQRNLTSLRMNLLVPIRMTLILQYQGIQLPVMATMSMRQSPYEKREQRKKGGASSAVMSEGMVGMIITLMATVMQVAKAGLSKEQEVAAP